jgi:outer membrane protein
MTRRIAACLFACLCATSAAAQTTTIAPSERLSLDAAIQLAVENNRQVQAALLEVDKAEADLAIARTRRLPVFGTEVNASQLLTPVSYSFPRGAFGDFPATGPIPATDTNVTVPQQPTLYVSSSVSQPLSQLVRINLGIKSSSVARDIEHEHARAQQLTVVNEVKRMYFAILQTQSALTAGDEAISLYRELDRMLTVRVAQQVALRSDSLDVQFRLAHEELSQTTRRNMLASQKEQLNQLLGRDVRTAFDVEDVSTISIAEIDLAAAHSQALASRPDVREARLTLQQAELDRRATKAERIPDISLAAAYTSNFNVDVLPRNLATLGVRMTWEPFDWGRKGYELKGKDRTIEQARLRVRETEDRAVIEINSRFRTLAEARARLAVMQMAQATSREKLRVKTNQYEIQAALLPDVMQLRADVAEATDGYQQALVSFWTAKADFEHAVGEEGIR